MERMTLREAAQRTARSITTLRRYIRSGRLRAEHLIARGLRRFAVLVRQDRGRELEAESFSRKRLLQGLHTVVVDEGQRIRGVVVTIE